MSNPFCAKVTRIDELTGEITKKVLTFPSMEDARDWLHTGADLAATTGGFEVKSYTPETLHYRTLEGVKFLITLLFDRDLAESHGVENKGGLPVC